MYTIYNFYDVIKGTNTGWMCVGELALPEVNQMKFAYQSLNVFEDNNMLFSNFTNSGSMYPLAFSPSTSIDLFDNECKIGTGEVSKCSSATKPMYFNPATKTTVTSKANKIVKRMNPQGTDVSPKNYADAQLGIVEYDSGFKAVD